MKQPKSVLLMTLVFLLKMEWERNIFLSRVQAEIRSCRRIESHDDVLRTSKAAEHCDGHDDVLRTSKAAEHCDGHDVTLQSLI